jgi:cephalosporin hydroxylase
MNGDKEFAHALSDYLALNTNLSSGYLYRLIHSFLRGAPVLPRLDPAAKNKIIGRLNAEVAAHNDVPNFFQNYLLTHLQQETWPPQAAFFAARYLHRSNERYVNWRRRQQQFSELEGESVSGTELGFSQMVYSQGVDSAFRWRGVPCFKTLHDLAIYPMLIHELQPGTIIELGAGSGGSGLLFADLCAAAGLKTKIISIDRQTGEVSDPRIEFIQADCAQWLAETAASPQPLQRPCLVIEDFHGELPGFFGHIDAILEAGDYLVVEDSLQKQSAIAQCIADRSYMIDTKYTDFFGINCTSAINSILRKSAEAHATRSQTANERQRLREQDRAWRQRRDR